MPTPDFGKLSACHKDFGCLAGIEGSPLPVRDSPRGNGRIGTKLPDFVEFGSGVSPICRRCKSDSITVC